MKQKLMVFSIYILLFIYNIYIKFLGKDNVQKNFKKTKSTNSKGIKNSSNLTTKNNDTFGLKLFGWIISLNKIELLDKLLSTNPNVVNQRDEDGNTPLMFSIIHHKDELLISKLLSYTTDINAKNNNGDHCLMLGIENGNKNLIDLILQSNVNVNNQNNQNNSPIFSAIAKGRYDIISSLMNKNINLNIRNKDGRIPIEEALASENVNLIKTLIEYGASTLVKDINDEYILFQLMSHPDLLKDIIEIESRSPNKKDLILTLRNKEGNTLFMEFCRHGYVKLAKFMMKHKADLNCVNRGENALTLAIREGQLEIVKLLLTCRNIDIHHVTSDNKTPLRIAIENENILIIKTLINYGGPLLLRNENENLLKNAINTSNIEIINLLLDININVDVKFGSEKNTPLIYTLKKILKDMKINTFEDEIMNSNAPLCSTDSDLDKSRDEEDGMSVASSVSSVTTLANNKSSNASSIIDNNYYSRVLYNMENESDNEEEEDHDQSTFIYESDDDTLSDIETIDIKTSENESNDGNHDHDSSFNKEKINNKRNINVINTDLPVLSHKDSFDKHYKVMDTSVLVDDNYCDILKTLLHHRAKINLTDDFKDSALILACRYGLRNVVELLLHENRQLNLDLDINKMDRYGNTALHNACKKNYTSIVQLLLSDDSININIQNLNGNSALMIAVYENNLEIIHELLKCENININTLNVQLETPLIAACRMNNYKIAKILIEHHAIINKRYDLNGETAIFHSIRNNNKKLTSLLLENEASVSFKNKNGKSPLNIAREYKYKSIVSLLFSHFKNLSALKNKSSTLSLNENIIRNEDKKTFFNKSHTRNAASLSITNGFSSAVSNSSLSHINELKNGNKPSLKFNRKLMNTPGSVTGDTYINKKHSRHESFNEGITNKFNHVATSGRLTNHTRNISFNPELLTNRTNKFEKIIKNEATSTSPSTSANEISTESATANPISPVNPSNSAKVHGKSYNTKNTKTTVPNENQSSHTSSSSPSRLKKNVNESKFNRNHSSNLSEHTIGFHKKLSSYNLKKAFHNEKSPHNIYDEFLKTNNNNEKKEEEEEEESDTEYTTNLLIEIAKEKVQNEAIANAAATASNSNSSSTSASTLPKSTSTSTSASSSFLTSKSSLTSISTSSNPKIVKRSRSQSSFKGEPKPDDYLKPLKTACYNKDLEEIEKFYKNLVQEKGNLYHLPDELFQQVKSNYTDEKERVKIIEKIKDYNKTRPTSMTTLSIDMFAFTLLFFSDNAEALETMLQYGLNPNMQNNALYTLLILACKKSQPKSALVLLDYNADPNYQNKYDETALVLACKKGLNDVIERLLQCHADVNLRNDKGETALVMACWKKNLPIVKRLLQQPDIDINLKNNLEESPLFLSCLQNSTAIAEVLLQHGADVNAANKNNETPIMIARKNNNQELIELLLKYGAKENN